MERIANTLDFQLEGESAVAIGKFDGVHLGHRRLLEEILSKKRDGLKACVFTFHPSPSVLFGGGDGRELTTREEKRVLFERLGVDVLVEFPLNFQTAAISPEAFVEEILFGRLHARFLAAGSDLSFGSSGRGNAALLCRMGRQLGFEAKIIEKVRMDGEVISSTYVRRQVEDGNLPLAGKLLGMPYPVMGEVLHGKRIGRRLGMPTLNLRPPENKLMPPCGVYLSTVRIRGREYRAVSNVGYKPTVTQERVLGLESYLYGFAEEVYGEWAEASLYEWVRPERKFADLDALRGQIAQDVRTGAAWRPFPPT